MELSPDETQLQDEAIKYIKNHEGELVEKFITSKNPLRVGFMTIFMAGSPGSGKTEFSGRYIPLIINNKGEKLLDFLRKSGFKTGQVDSFFIHIDVDEIRKFMPQYKKTDTKIGVIGNSHVIQKAANKGLDILREYCLKNEISFLHDGTFGNYETMRKLVKASIRRGREVQIYYLYLDPLAAWEFTKAREYLEGRNILKEKFIEQYFKSRENVDKIKKEFGEDVTIHCVLKDSDNKVIETAFNEKNIDKYLELKYNDSSIKRYSQEDLSSLIF